MKKLARVRNALMVLLPVTITILLVYGIGLAAVDDAYTVRLFHMNGEDASTTFVEESGASITPHGDAQIDTAQSMYGGASAYFDGTGDYLTLPNSSAYDFGTGDFSIEFWIKFNGTQDVYDGIITTSTSGATGLIIGTNPDNAIRVINNDTQLFVTSSLTSAWHHIALIRYGNTFTAYIDGASNKTYDCTGISFNSSGSGLAIGSLLTSGSNNFTGWIDEFRISKGIARYTSNFSTPAGPFIPTNTSTATETFTPTATQTFTPTATETFTPTATETFTPTATETFTPTATQTFTPTATETFTPTATNTPTDTVTPGGPTPTSTDTLTPTLTLPPGTATYVAAYARYKSLAEDNLPTTTLLSVLCGILILAGIVIGAIWITKRKQ